MVNYGESSDQSSPTFAGLPLLGKRRKGCRKLQRQELVGEAIELKVVTLINEAK